MPRTTELKKMLLEQEMSQQALAEKIGIAPTVLNMIANGWRRPTSEQAKKIARILGVSRKKLFTEELPNGN